MPIDWDKQLLAPCHATFGVQATYYPGSGLPVTVAGVFSDQFRDEKFEDATAVSVDVPMVNIRASILPSVPCQNELIRITDPLRGPARGILYVITRVEADGLGDLKILLRASSDAEAVRKRAAGI